MHCESCAIEESPLSDRDNGQPGVTGVGLAEDRLELYGEGPSTSQLCSIVLCCSGYVGYVYLESSALEDSPGSTKKHRIEDPVVKRVDRLLW